MMKTGTRESLWAPVSFLLAGVLVWASGCKSGSEFSSATPTTSHKSDASTASTSADTCTKDGMTKATLQTAKIKSGGTSQFLQYEVALTDCDGSVISLANKPVLFDIDAVLVPDVRPLPIVVTNVSSDTPTFNIAGMLALVQGTDLFGNSGAIYYHHATDNLNYGGDAKRIILKINLSGLSFQSLDGSYDGVHGSASMATYLRIGASVPLKMDVLVY